MRRALSTLVSQGPFLYTEIEETGIALERKVTMEIVQIREERGEALIEGMMDWVRLVRFRALQDYAAEHLHRFQEAWCTLFYWEWGSQAKQWGRALQTREDRDIGWVPSLSTPSWSTCVAELRVDILKQSREIGVAVEVEDKDRWVSCVGTITSEEPTESALYGEGAQSEDDAMEMLEAASVLAVVDSDGSHGVLTRNNDDDEYFPTPSRKSPTAQVMPAPAVQGGEATVDPNLPSVGATVVSRGVLPQDVLPSVTEAQDPCSPNNQESVAGVGKEDEDPYAEVSPLKGGPGAIQVAHNIQNVVGPSCSSHLETQGCQALGTIETCAPDDGAKLDDHCSAAIFPEITEAMQEDSIEKNPEPLLTVTQVVKGACEVGDIPQRGLSLFSVFLNG